MAVAPQNFSDLSCPLKICLFSLYALSLMYLFHFTILHDVSITVIKKPTLFEQLSKCALSKQPNLHCGKICSWILNSQSHINCTLHLSLKIFHICLYIFHRSMNFFTERKSNITFSCKHWYKDSHCLRQKNLLFFVLGKLLLGQVLNFKVF